MENTAEQNALNTLEAFTVTLKDAMVLIYLQHVIRTTASCFLSLANMGTQRCRCFSKFKTSKVNT